MDLGINTPETEPTAQPEAERKTNNRQGRRKGALAWLILYFIAALAVGNTYLHFTGSFAGTFYQRPDAGFDAMVDGTAARPFVGRFLIPVVIHTFDDITPGRMRGYISNNWWRSPYFMTEFDYAPAEYREVVFYLLSILLFLGIGLAGKWAYKQIDENETHCWLAGLILMLSFQLWMRRIAMIYDPSNVLLATVLVGLCLHNANKDKGLKMWPVFIFYALAMANKETAIFFLPIIAISSFGKMDWPGRFATLLILGFETLVIQAYRMWAFADTPGVWTEYTWAHTNSQIWHFAMSFVWAMLMLAFSMWMMIRCWKDAPPILKIGFFTIFIPELILMFPFGNLDEIRALYDALPIVAFIAMPKVLESLGFGGKRQEQLAAA